MLTRRKECQDFQSLAPGTYDAVQAWTACRQRRHRQATFSELIKLRASQINGCAFCVQFHILQSESLGIPTDKLNLVVVWREAPQFSPRERATLSPGPKR